VYYKEDGAIEGCGKEVIMLLTLEYFFSFQPIFLFAYQEILSKF
jgi:hypothetical protein